MSASGLGYAWKVNYLAIITFKMKIVVADAYPLNPGDLNWKYLADLGEFIAYVVRIISASLHLSIINAGGVLS